MNNIKKNTATQLVTMIIITIITQVFILIRASIIASRFGVSEHLDAFNFVNSISIFIFSFISVGITTVLIPNLGAKEKRKAVNSFLIILYGIATLLLIFSIIFRGKIINIFSQNTSASFIEVSSLLMIILLVSQYIASFMGLSNAVLQFENKFNRSKIIILITNILMVILLIIKRGCSINYYAAIVLLTTVINVILQFILVYKSSFKFNFLFDIKDLHLKMMLRIFLPTILSTGLYQFSLIIDTVIASGLGEGNISILNYSNYIIGMINILLVANITTFLYPKIVTNIENKNYQKELAKYIMIINSVLSFIVLGMIVLGKDVLEILYMRGEFTSEINLMVYYCTIIYIIAVPANAVRDIIYKYFYANNDTYTPFKNSLVISAINIILSIIFVKYIGLYGVVLGTTLTSLMSVIFISIRFKKIYGFNFNGKSFLIENIKIFINVIILLVLFQVIKNTFNFGGIVNILLYTPLIFIPYIGGLYIFKSEVFRMKL